MSKKGQAAMEFLMTYGWAILVVLIVIGALAYFGVLNPQSLVADRCALTVGVQCVDYKISQGGSLISIQNGLGYDIVVNRVNISSTGSLTTGCTWVAGGVTVIDGATQGFTMTACTPAINANQIGSKKKFNVNINYSKVGAVSGAYTHDITGDIYTTIQG
jgi:hypothetical protein